MTNNTNRNKIKCWVVIKEQELRDGILQKLMKLSIDAYM